MAMIKCPECGRDISEKAKSCPGCGFQLNDSCSDENSETPQKFNPKKTHASLRKKILLPICIVLCITVIVGVFAAIKQQERKQYLTDAETAYMMIWVGSITAEQTGTLIHDTWNDAILNQDNYGTVIYNSKATSVDEELKKLYRSEKYKHKISVISNCLSEAEELLEKLDNPPRDYSYIYEELKEYYNSFVKLAELVTSPSEFLDTVTADLSDFDTRMFERLQALQSALQSSQSATGMLGDSISAIRSAYGSLDSYDESTLFEKTANGIHLNTTELQKLEKESQNIDGKYIDAYLDNLIDKYKSLSEQMADIGSFTPEYTNLSLQRDGILSQIRDLELLQAQYAGATSAYKQWVDAQSGGEEGDMYDSTRSGFSRLDELRKQRLVGTNEFRAGVQALSYEDMSDKSDGEVMTWYDQNREKLSRYFAEGSAGLKNMAADLAKINSEWVKFDENGNVLGWTVDIEEAAKALGISAEMVQAAEKKASDYGYKVNLSSSFSDDVKRRLEEAGYGADSLSDKLQQANEKLQELGRTSINFDFNTKDESKLDLEIKAARELLDGFRDMDGNVDVSVEGAAEAQNILMQLLIAKRSIAEEPAILKVKTDGADAEGALQDIKELASFIDTYDWESIKIAAGVDADKAKAKIDEEFAKIKDNPPEILAKLGIDTSSLESSEDLRNALQQVTEQALIEVGIDSEKIDSFLAEEHDGEGSFHWINDDSEVKAFKAAKHTTTGTITWKNKTKDPVTGVDRKYK